MTTISVARYQFKVELDKALPMPEYAGSMLRGCFGHALKQTSCITKQTECTGCLLRSSCAYSTIFEPEPRQDLAWSLKQSPPPYIIEPNTRTNRVLHAGETYSFCMTLFGPALEQLSFIILAWQRAWQRGVGKYRCTGGLKQVNIETSDGWQNVYDSESAIIKPHSACVDIAPTTPTSTLHLHFQTPLRIVNQGRPIGPDKINAQVLLKSVLRRYDLIAQYYFEHRQELGKHYLFQLEKIDIQHDLGWRDWARYSNRQQRKMSLGGMVGTLSLHGDLNPLYPFIKAGEWLHIGKNTTFGLGQYKISEEN